ncbi:MAG: hypothetical protein UT43_C0025G0003 [Parcubacteria group bacterium GW2011_GWC1_39_29]|uniref:Uncharacterized protein n=1 Tax=Candidatus Yanofskybacteria bacterium GW2011_GWD1_39_16 TaxID=1619030 RepID=A0A837HS27_9BACT|nr:MAG: hypothetical protein UT35_C0018G0006 [Candidatus Yanofskybacteria bacterium GW2011_GWD1_39_16]KKR14475.1 MAG: hypothetical protein UT43_C0025G0003 [Parcubacteria group bacterium GW2011_GWC1_39_29]
MSWLTSKISRKKLDKLIASYASDDKVFEIGVYGSPSYGIFMIKKVFGSIRKDTEEPEAFASAFFLAAIKLPLNN